MSTWRPKKGEHFTYPSAVPQTKRHTSGASSQTPVAGELCPDQVGEVADGERKTLPTQAMNNHISQKQQGKLNTN